MHMSVFPRVLDWINVYGRRRCDTDRDNEVRISADGAGRDVVGGGHFVLQLQW